MDVPTLIRQRVAQALPRMPEHLALWAKAHLVSPRPVELFTSVDGADVTPCWLVTDHTGQSYSGCRVVFDEETGLFGHETTVHPGGRAVLLGLVSADFAQTVEAM
jgi:hypothetical protein